MRRQVFANRTIVQVKAQPCFKKRRHRHRRLLTKIQLTIRTTLSTGDVRRTPEEAARSLVAMLRAALRASVMHVGDGTIIGGECLACASLQRATSAENARTFLMVMVMYPETILTSLRFSCSTRTCSNSSVLLVTASIRAQDSSLIGSKLSTQKHCQTS